MAVITSVPRYIIHETK